MFTTDSLRSISVFWKFTAMAATKKFLVFFFFHLHNFLTAILLCLPSLHAMQSENPWELVSQSSFPIKSIPTLNFWWIRFPSWLYPEAPWFLQLLSNFYPKRCGKSHVCEKSSRSRILFHRCENQGLLWPGKLIALFNSSQI